MWGEASGDLHGSNLIKEISKKSYGRNKSIWWQNAMLVLKLSNISSLAFIGFYEVLSIKYNVK